MIKKIGYGVAAVLLLLIVVAFANMFFKNSLQPDIEPVAALKVDVDSAALSLATAIRFRTISSFEDASLNDDQFRKLHDHLRQRYPLVHSRLKREVVNELSLIYVWPGSDTSLKPIALMAHQDVVPIAPGTEEKWESAPFSGEIKDGFVWGRGSWDDKGNLIAELEAVEMLLQEGFQPRRTVYFIFGADEEVSGHRGAKSIAKILKDRGVQFEYVLDEGLMITEGIMAGIDAPMALIGIAEKGYLSLKLEAETAPGHSSMPPPSPNESAIAQISQALVKLDNNPMPGGIQGVVAEMLSAMAPEMKGIKRFAMSNIWLLGPVIKKQLAGKANTNAMLRTTTALTIVNAGNKENVLPGRAEAVVNFRLLPGDTDQSVIDYVQKTIANDQIKVSVTGSYSAPSKVSSTSSDAYLSIRRTVREVFPGTLVVPGLMVAATDSRYMDSIADNVFRFAPVRAKSDDLARFHGTNERLSIENLGQMIGFYHRLLTVTAGDGK